MRSTDETEFTDLVMGVSSRLLRTAYAVCGDRQLSEDAVQSAFASAFRSWRRVRAADNPEAYLRRMVVNELLSRRRRKSWPLASATQADPQDSHHSYEESVVDHDLVWSAISDLPPRQRAVVVLRYYEDLSEAEIAETLGVRPGTVKSQSAAALDHLRRSLGEPADVDAPHDHPTRTGG
jgi:RNA polymerase sigma-70 factor (sigma-E family)